MDRKLELLAGVPLLARLDRKGLEAISGLCDEVDLPAGKTVVKEGTYGTEFYVVIDGALRVEQHGAHLTDLGPGSFFGELALLARIQRTATVVTTAPTRVLVMGAREFTTLLRDHPTIQEAVLHAVAERMARMDTEHHTH